MNESVVIEDEPNKNNENTSDVKLDLVLQKIEDLNVQVSFL